eukprot:TRINITY_DN4990_c0_g1_i1.p1 TRINITY_DN4990_c0_g1~~TRINITY_DN4990_c0_g1_i1.p1  ORF type:complete len:491 (-),score=66.33 TRINITY_DN4990_c0_g1_i1:240-1676(-)
MSLVVNCTSGVYDCDFDDSSICAEYNEKFEDPDDLTWVMSLAAIFAALMSYGLGANDAANSWGTAIGSKAVSLRIGLLIGGIAEWLGAVSLGYGVSSTIQSGVSDYNDSECWACGYCDSKMTLYSMGMFTALVSASIFLMIATFTSMPVSTTHAIIGAVVGSTTVGVGFQCLSWGFDGGLGGIAASWVISPLLSGFIACLAFVITRSYIIRSEKPRRNALIGINILFGATTFIMVFLIFLKSPLTKKLEHWIMFICAFSSALIIAGLVQKILIPRLKKKLPSQMSQGSQTEMSVLDTIENRLYSVDDDVASVDPSIAVSSTPLTPEQTHLKTSKNIDGSIEEYDSSPEIADALYCFRPLLIFQAVLESFAHGANDTANATAAFSSVMATYSSGLTDCTDPKTEEWVLLIAGFFVFSWSEHVRCSSRENNRRRFNQIKFSSCLLHRIWIHTFRCDCNTFRDARLHDTLPSWSSCFCWSS